jgi:hypothetical protein
MSTAARTLLVAYDLGTCEARRSDLNDAIMTIGEAWARPLDTVWVVRTRLTPEAVEMRLSPLIGDDDGLIVQETRGEVRLTNTGLRWFRPRRSAAADALETAAIVAFPHEVAANDEVARLQPLRAAS